MFSYDTGYDYDLQAVGKKHDGTSEVLDVSTLFKFPVGAHGNRFLETPRDIQSMQLLARYLCKKFTVESITINDISWVRYSGKRIELKDVSPELVSTSPWIQDYACGS